MSGGNGWQPIATAPEGERVLVSYLFHGRQRRTQVTIAEKSNGKFIWPSRYYEAVAWQPLPPPPDAPAATAAPTTPGEAV